MELANANGRRGATVYEVLSHDGVQDNEYMSIGKALEGDKRKRQPDPKGSNKQSNIDKTLAEQAKYLNMLKVVSVILAISMVIATVTFGVLIHELMGQIKDLEHASVDGGWTDWSFWSSCYVTCGNGHAIRQRFCTNPTPANGGLSCAGPRTEQNACTIANCPGHKSAFTVTHPTAGPTNYTIRFTHIVTNIGGHYNTTSGQFTCHYPGTYVFLLHIYKNADETWVYCYIRKNGNRMIFVESHVQSNISSSLFGSSNSVVLHLDYGDTIDTGDCTAFDTFYNRKQTSFSGFLLQED